MGPFWRENQSVRTPPKDLKGELRIWRIKMQARVQGSVLLKDSICFKWVQIGSYGFGPWDPPNPKRPLTRDVKIGGYG